METMLNENDLDFFFMTETKLNVRNARIKGYKIKHHFRKNSKQKGGGLGFYIKEDLWEHVHALDVDNHDDFMGWRLHTENNDLLIFVAYGP